MRIHAKSFAAAARSLRSPSDTASTSGEPPSVQEKRKEPQTPGCRRDPARAWVALLSTILWVVRTLLAEDQASAAPARPDRAPYSESAIQSTLVTQHTSAGPLRLQSGTFLPLGATEVNLARARAARADGSRIHAILQFDPTPNSASRETLSAMGVRLLGYLPDKAFFAGIPRGISADDLKRAGVEWAGAVYPEDKLPPRIQSSGVGFWALRADGSANLWIRYYPDVSPEDAVRDLAQFEANVVGLDEKLNRITVGALFNQIAAIAARDWVRWIEEVPPPPRTFNDGARADVQADTVQTAPYDLSGAGVVLGIWDGGSVDPTHEDFAGRLVLAETNVGVHFHATHVAGTMAGSGQYSLTAGGTDRQWHGMAPGSSIVSYEFSDP